jgi:hypothetical protein
VRAIDHAGATFAKVMWHVVVEKSMKMPDLARVPKTGVTYDTVKLQS